MIIIKPIVKNLVKELRECPEGTRISTAELLRRAGREEDIDSIDLIAIHNELVEAAKVDNIILDMSEHDCRVEGLSYNLEYIVHNKNAK